MAKVDLFQDFRELLEALNLAGVEYMVIGGYAVIHYGYRRTTDDLDVWIAVSPENAERVSHVLQTWGHFPATAVPAAIFLDPRRAFIFGHEPVRMDLLTGPDGVDFDQCYTRRKIVDWDGVPVSLIALSDLKSNKRASGRAKDLADLDNLPAD